MPLTPAPSRKTRNHSTGLHAFVGLLAVWLPEETPDPQNLPAGEASRFAEEVKGDTEGELNCDELVFPRAGLPVLIQMEATATPEREAVLRALGKIAVRRAVLEADGLLADLHAEGAIGGLEVDWFFPGGDSAPAGPNLGVVGELWGDGPTLHARVHAYDEAQYASRKAAVEAMVGHPLVTRTVWADDVVASAPSAASELRIVGHVNSFHGRVASGGSLEVIGYGNQLVEGYVADSAAIDASTLVVHEAHADPVTSPALPLDVGVARAQAQAAGTYHPGKLVLAGGLTPPDGLYFAEKDILVVGSGADRQWTLVSATGDVVVIGSGNSIRPHTAHTTALAFEGRVALLGAWNHVEGQLLAPLSELRVGGWANLLHGVLRGDGVSISGVANVVSDGTHVGE